ncbi:vWA domain-containing protein [Phaeodactylibacter luteus]|uniref:vWA domain-containing protein n=1 Tax=Phaeodactylibacter luteus TaxID=1564516 RepID=UPI001B8804FD|nr:VWA domain-containing protein [Phaeodactylibacter luteus]
MDRPLIKRQTTLTANVVAFCRFLRQKGYTVGPREEADALQALLAIAPFHSPEAMQLCLRAALARTYAQLHTFDELYTQYWRELDKAVDSKLKDGAPEPGQKQKPKRGAQEPSLMNIKNWLQGNTQQEEAEMAAYSAQEALSHKDFSVLAEAEMEEMRQLIARIARALARRESRRRKASPKPLQLDLRRTLRTNMRRGGELLELRYYKPARHKKQIVLLCDVSKSMDLYSRFLIQFMYGLQSAYQHIETFVFSTQLYRATAALRQRDFGQALSELSGRVPGWSGGTRIGESFHAFSNEHANRLLNKQTVVIIMSDGWDTGDTALLGESMKRIHQRAGKVIWLNPLAGSQAYEPETQGMQAAMPYIDVFAPGHNAESLKALQRQLR